MTSPSKRKGNRMELDTVAILKDYHLEARKVPLSGAAAHFKGDVLVDVHWQEKPLQLECKIRANGFAQIYGWLDGNDALVIRADRQRALVVIDIELFAKLIQ
jgi:hypothetical protein